MRMWMIATTPHAKSRSNRRRRSSSFEGRRGRIPYKSRAWSVTENLYRFGPWHHNGSSGPKPICTGFHKRHRAVHRGEMELYFINLSRRPDRREAMETQARRLGLNLSRLEA